MPAPLGSIPLVLSGAAVVGATLRLQSASGQVRCDTTSAPGGGPTNKYEAPFPTPQLVWIINHNMGFRPNVRTYSPGGREMLGEMVHTSQTQAVVYFDGAVAGFAVCS